MKNEKNTNLYTPIGWPEIQDFMEYKGFRKNAHLINDEEGYAQFGSSAYFVSVEWLNSLAKGTISTGATIGHRYLDTTTGEIVTLITIGPERVALKYPESHNYMPYDADDEGVASDCKEGLVGFRLEHFLKYFKPLKD